MYRRTWMLGVLVLVVLLASACQPIQRPPGSGAPVDVAKLDDAMAARIDAYVTEQQDRNRVPGLAIAIVKDGQPVYEKGFGVANVDSGRPVTPGTVFRLADIAMIPTTIAVLQLVEQGKIDLDAPVTTYLPYFQLQDERYKDITVRHILEGKSGIEDVYDIARIWDTYPVDNEEGAIERYVRGMAQPSRLFSSRLAFAPGRVFVHSYIARIILGDIIQKVSGQSYEEYVDEHLFAPLGMEHSTFLLDAVDPALLASPHVITEYGLAQANIVVSDLIPFSREFAASDNLYSNAEDMSRMMAALLNGGELEGARILTPESVKLLSARSGAALDPIQQYTWGYEHPAHLYVGYGMGSFIDEIEGCSVYHLFGLQLGYRANIMLCPDQKLGVVLMGNRGQNERLTPGGDEFYANEMLPDLMSMLLGAE